MVVPGSSPPRCSSRVRSGVNVRVAGIKAGRVTGIKADRQDGKVVVSMVVNKGVHLGPDTRAEVALETLLGTKFVRLSFKVDGQNQDSARISDPFRTSFLAASID